MPSTYARKKPGKSTSRPVVRNSTGAAVEGSTMVSRAVVVAMRASAIWVATVRFQMRS